MIELPWNSLKKSPNALQGSEWVEPHPRRSPSQHLYNPPTLEQLINNPFPSQSLHQRLSMDDSTSVVSAATEFSSKEITRLENRVTRSKLFDFDFNIFLICWYRFVSPLVFFINFTKEILFRCLISLLSFFIQFALRFSVLFSCCGEKPFSKITITRF